MWQGELGRTCLTPTPVADRQPSTQDNSIILCDCETSLQSRRGLPVVVEEACTLPSASSVSPQLLQISRQALPVPEDSKQASHYHSSPETTLTLPRTQSRPLWILQACVYKPWSYFFFFFSLSYLGKVPMAYWDWLPAAAYTQSPRIRCKMTFLWF